jgi:hypothetical protein
MRAVLVTNNIPLGWTPPLTVTTINDVATLKATPNFFPRYALVPWYMTPLPDLTIKQHITAGVRAVCAAPIGFGVGFAVALPLHLPWQYLQRVLKEAVAPHQEDGEDHLTRRLLHAREHAKQVRGRVEIPSLRGTLPPPSSSLTLTLTPTPTRTLTLTLTLTPNPNPNP